MPVRTLLLYLIGNRKAILEIAADRRCFWIGLLFVISAAMAREYDGHDLLEEPIHLLAPVLASLAASFILFLIVGGQMYFRHHGRPPFGNAYRSFLTLFWMTAPLAWLYAIPYERFLSEADATSANLWTLALVALWRVLLMVRVVSVITGRRPWTSFFLVMIFADVVALTTAAMMPKPVISFMGGVRATESELIVQGVTLTIGILGILSAPIWAIGALVALIRTKPVWQVPQSTTQPLRGLLALAVVSVLVFIPLTIWMQSQLHLRTKVEQAMAEGRIAEALDLMSAHQPRDFPPHWDPPPKIGDFEEKPPLGDVMDVLVARPHADWVRSRYVEKFRRQFGQYEHIFEPRGEKLAAVVRILKKLPEGPAIAAARRGAVEARLRENDVPVADWENLLEILKLAKRD